MKVNELTALAHLLCSIREDFFTQLAVDIYRQYNSAVSPLVRDIVLGCARLQWDDYGQWHENNVSITLSSAKYHHTVEGNGNSRLVARSTLSRILCIDTTQSGAAHAR